MDGHWVPVQWRKVAAGASVLVSAFALLNHWRIRRSRSTDYAHVVVRPKQQASEVGPSERPVLLFIHGTCHNAAYWQGYMESLSDGGWECHALTLGQGGTWVTTWAEQIRQIRETLVEIGRPVVLVGHSQGGCKAEVYVRSPEGDAAAPSHCKVVGLVLMGSCGFEQADVADLQWYFLHWPSLLASLPLGLEAALPFGGGPQILRHFFQRYKVFFKANTTTTTLLGSRAGAVPLRTFSDVAMVDHEPFPADAFVFDTARLAHRGELMRAGLHVLILSGSCDRCIPPRLTEDLGVHWGVPVTYISEQGHDFGDPGWEQSVVPILEKFLEKFQHT
eukprot:TRINITY_DN43749_c0_g1_i1.p1 TRINITY_DN43749_c0_g1~~TRINITY_DN43749_c0_g1_i1.p1  ORF type:complete len:333 (-),score=16.12 TRINITY_DN43749_c0_g1_i1:120-1118(-)